MSCPGFKVAKMHNNRIAKNTAAENAIGGMEEYVNNSCYMNIFSSQSSWC
jgi:hypothetical protein